MRHSGKFAVSKINQREIHSRTKKEETSTFFHVFPWWQQNCHLHSHLELPLICRPQKARSSPKTERVRAAQRVSVKTIIIESSTHENVSLSLLSLSFEFKHLLFLCYTFSRLGPSRRLEERDKVEERKKSRARWMLLKYALASLDVVVKQIFLQFSVPPYPGPYQLTRVYANFPLAWLLMEQKEKKTSKNWFCISYSLLFFFFHHFSTHIDSWPRSQGGKYETNNIIMSNLSRISICWCRLSFVARDCRLSRARGPNWIGPTEQYTMEITTEELKKSLKYWDQLVFFSQSN